MTPATAERQRETSLMEGQLAALKANPRELEIVDTMCSAYADKQAEIEHGTRYRDCAKWPLLNDDSKDAMRLGMVSAMHAARRLKANRDTAGA